MGGIATILFHTKIITSAFTEFFIKNKSLGVTKGYKRLT